MPAIKPERKKRSGSRALLLLLVFFFITVLIILFFQSSVSKIATVDIKGNELVTAARIGQAAQVSVGDHYFTTSVSAVEKRIRNLPMIKSATVAKSFPGKLSITVEEHPRVAYQFSADGTLQVLLADGSAIAAAGTNVSVDKPILSGWRDDDPWKLKLCQTLAAIPSAMLSDLSEIKPDPTNAYEDKIKIYTRSQYVVSTTVTYLPDRLPYLGAIVSEMKDKNVNSGQITLLETDRVSPFVSDANAKDGKNGKPAGDAKDTGKKTDAKKTPSPTPTPKQSNSKETPKNTQRN